MELCQRKGDSSLSLSLRCVEESDSLKYIGLKKTSWISVGWSWVFAATGWVWAVGVVCVLSEQGERTLQVEVFAPGVWEDGRVRLSPFTKKIGESGLLRTRQREEFSFGHRSTWHLALGTSTEKIEGSQNELSRRSQHEQTPPPSAPPPVPHPPPTRAGTSYSPELQIWVHLPPPGLPLPSSQPGTYM